MMLPHVDRKFKPERIFPSLAAPPRQMTPDRALAFFTGLAKRGYGTLTQGAPDGNDP